MHQFVSSVKSYTICIQIVYNSHSPKHVFSCDSFKMTPLERCTCHLGNSPNHQIVYRLYTICIQSGTSTRNCIRIVYNSAFGPIVYKLYTIGRFLTPPCIQIVYKLYTICIQIVYNCIQITAPHTPPPSSGSRGAVQHKVPPGELETQPW